MLGCDGDHLAKCSASTSEPANVKRYESDEPAEANDGRPEIPLSKIVDGRKVVLGRQRRDHDQSGRDHEQDLPEPAGQRSVGVELRQHRQRQSKEEVGHNAIRHRQRLGERASHHQCVPPEPGRQQAEPGKQSADQ
jgi:hypothetical protein